MYYGCICWTNHWHFSSFRFLSVIEAMRIRTNWTIQALGRQFKAWPTQGCSTEQMYSPEGHYFVQSRAQKRAVPSAEKWTLAVSLPKRFAKKMPGNMFVCSPTLPPRSSWVLAEAVVQCNIGVWVLAWNLAIDHWMSSPEQILQINPGPTATMQSSSCDDVPEYWPVCGLVS